MSNRFTAADREFLDREYDARIVAPTFQKDVVFREASARVAFRLDRIADLVYDEKSGSKLDIYPAGQCAPVFVWIHGGYWRSSTKDDHVFVAPELVANGIAVANIDYTLAPGATMDEIVRQVRSSIAWLLRHGARYGLDTRRLHIGGHSAGGHLVGMLLANGWRSSSDWPIDLFGAALTVSGLHDLQPLIHSFVNEPLSLNEEIARRNSPIHCLPDASGAHLIAACGGLESSEFHRQTTSYLEAWRARGLQGELVEMPGFHHFDIILELERAGNPLFDTLLNRIRSIT